jgi:dihydropteroate synthase
MSFANNMVVHTANVPNSVLARLVKTGRTVVMGILNVTPDSFSDGGQFLAPELAIAQAKRMIAEGADIIDIGAESTRPYGDAVPVPATEERARLEPILPVLNELGTPLSIDTMKAEIAAWALDAGAVVVNDVWGLQRDSDMARVISEHA